MYGPAKPNGLSAGVFGKTGAAQCLFVFAVGAPAGRPLEKGRSLLSSGVGGYSYRRC